MADHNHYMSKNMIPKDQNRMIEDILAGYKNVLGRDHRPYKNHINRIVSYCYLLQNDLDSKQKEKIIIAACFHDLGIWTDKTFNYLAPSIRLVKTYLKQLNLQSLFCEIELMIKFHHKLRPYVDEDFPLVDLFRKADWIDVSHGMLKFGLASEKISYIQQKYPNVGFHKRLVQLTIRELFHNPLKPLPMFKW